MRRKKIHDTEFLKLIDSGIPRKEIATRFGCSQAAISKRLARLRPEESEPLKIDSLTEKEQRFVTAIVSGDTQTNAVLKAYEVTTRDSAKSLGCTLMKNPDIRTAIAEIREREIPVPYLMKKLRQHCDSPDGHLSLKAVDIGLKLHDAYPVSKQINANITVHPVDLSKYRNDSFGIEQKD